MAMPTATHGTVYRAITADGEVLYVGMSTNLRRRLKDHAGASAWWPLAARIESDDALPLAEAFRSESDQIIALRPRFNQNGGIAQYFGHVEPDAESWRAMYEQRGMTIEEIALEVGTSTNNVRAHLVAAGTTMRRPGQRKGLSPKPNANAKDSDAPSGAVVAVVFGGTRAVHRRRGWKRSAA